MGYYNKIINFDYEKVNKLKNAPFKYMIITKSIKEFWMTLTAEQIYQNIDKDIEYIKKYGNFNIKDDREDLDEVSRRYMYISNIYPYISSIIEELNKKLYKIVYTSIPDPSNWNCELVTIVQVENNKYWVIFSDNKEYLQLIKNKE